MQEQPISRAEFNQLVEQVKRIERETEPMRLERRLSIPEANTLQSIMDMVARQGPDIATLKVDVSKIEKRLDKIESTMATKDDLKAIEKRFDAIKELQEQILDRLSKP
jgi:tetrahydromethanopterin S-methyltransferase subunit G